MRRKAWHACCSPATNAAEPIMKRGSRSQETLGNRRDSENIQDGTGGQDRLKGNSSSRNTWYFKVYQRGKEDQGRVSSLLIFFIVIAQISLPSRPMPIRFCGDDKCSNSTLFLKWAKHNYHIEIDTWYQVDTYCQTFKGKHGVKFIGRSMCCTT